MTKDFHQIQWDAQLNADCGRLVSLAIAEDVQQQQDWTTCAVVSESTRGQAILVAREGGVVAGLPVAEIVLAAMQADAEVELHVDDGTHVVAGQSVAQLRGAARDLLIAERLILNFVGRLSGIATLTNRYVDAIASSGACIYDTRKTTPGWRRLEKYAVRQGGGRNHRTGLFDAVLIKDNHLAIGAGDGKRFSPAEAVRQARRYLQQHQRDMLIEVEVDNLDQLRDVLPAAPNIVLLDNMSPQQMRAAVAIRDACGPAVQLEASGGISLDTVAAVASTGVERISVGALTHHATSLDVALDWLL